MNKLRQLIELCIEILKKEDFYMYVGDEKIEKDAKTLKESFEDLEKKIQNIYLQKNDKEIISKLYNDLTGIKENFEYEYYELYNKLNNIFEKCENIINKRTKQNISKNEDQNLVKKQHSMYDITFTMKNDKEIEKINLGNEIIKNDEDLKDLIGDKVSIGYRKQAICLLYYIVLEYEKQKKKCFEINLGGDKVLNFINKMKGEFGKIIASRNSFPNYISALNKLIKNSGAKLKLEDIGKTKKRNNREINDKRIYMIKN